MQGTTVLPPTRWTGEPACQICGILRNNDLNDDNNNNKNTLKTGAKEDGTTNV